MAPHRLGVLGWPVAHSLSPVMHEAAYRALGLRDWTYQKLPVPPDVFDETVRALEGAGFVGANVTIPHKEAALRVADEASHAAREIGAANTLTLSGGRVVAENTDAPGLLATLERAGRRVPASALVLGAGGSARAVVWALVNSGVGDVQLWNRTAERARALTDQLGGRAVKEPEQAELVVNCTAIGLAGDDDGFAGLARAPEEYAWACVVDLVYREGETGLVARARERGLATVDGREILVAQGALSFERWTGREAPVDAMRAAVT
jgi:shikimate dehydrogenase